ncbi:MAG: hypothetical protein ABJB69_02925 [Spartobacteria bacterium]
MNLMFAAAHFANPIFLLLVAVVLLFRWLASKATEANKDSPDEDARSTSTSDESITRAPVGSEEERIRKFLEALGQPPGSRPPPSVPPRTRTIIPRVPTLVRPLPALRTKPPDLPVAPTIPSPTPFSPAAAESTLFEVQQEAPTLAKSKPRAGDMNIVDLVRSPSGLRNAVLLREILGTPRAFQPFESIGSA